MSPAELEALLGQMHRQPTLPELQYHFDQHGREFGVQRPEEYRRLFDQHVARQDLRYFTLLRRSGQEAIWYVVATDWGAVTQYNETRRTWWSFFRPKDLGKFLRSGLGWWIEVRRHDAGWGFGETWTR